MSSAEDDDLKALRAASWALKELKSAFAQFAPKTSNDVHNSSERAQNQTDMDKVCDLVSVEIKLHIAKKLTMK